ncbi:MAG: SDR family NAD(P)-dependent oxidoreductase [Acidisphaera sp.]|nr:SDR family NAD(P)-dependent oxidoreductase [Acidisphaera sp.]
MPSETRPFAIVTGASTGIGYELARECLENGYDVLIAADEPEIEQAARNLRRDGARIEPVQADLSGPEGVDKLYAAVAGRKVDALLANAGRGLGRGFLDQDDEDWRRVVDTNITGTLLLVQKVGRAMREAGAGRILITGSIAGFMPGTFQAVYNGTKAFLDSFSYALRHELKGSGVSVTCLMPGATETEFFERADMMDTKVGQQKKADPGPVAKAGFQAMMKGQGEVVTGWDNKLRAAIAHIAPADALAEMHRGMAEPKGESAKT